MSYRELEGTVLLGGAFAAVAAKRELLCAQALTTITAQWQKHRKERSAMPDALKDVLAPKAAPSHIAA